MDKYPNTGNSTGGDKPEKTPTGDVGSSAVTPPPPAPPAAAQDVPTDISTPVNVGTRHVITARSVTTPANAGTGSVAARSVTITPARTFRTPENARDGNGGQSGGTANRAQRGTEKRVSASSGIVPAGGSPVETSQRRKRNRADHEVGGSSSRPRTEDPDTGIPPPCCVCGKQFASWKALFGHMRNHPDRQWRGVFPPPTFNPDGSDIVPVQPESSRKSQNDLPSTLLNIAKGVLEKIGGVDLSSGQNRHVLDLDLNVALEPIESPPPVSSSPPPPAPSPPPPRSPTPPPRRDGNGHPNLDLNKSPPQE